MNFRNSEVLFVARSQGALKFARTIIAKTFRALGPTEKKIVFFLLAVFGFSLSGLGYNFWIGHTVPAPAEGGTLTEGVIGTPRYINPVLAQANEVDLDLSRLLFSSLFSVAPDGALVPDLADKYAVSDDKKTYTIKIRENARWHDGEKLTSDDVLFTVKAIQNPDYKSPIRANLTGIEAEKIDALTVKFSLKAPYEPFLQNLAFGILPSHIWQYISADNTPLAEYNIKPVGSGPYKLERITKDKLGKIISMELAVSDSYYGRRPYIAKIAFKFFKNQEALLEAINSRQVDSTAYLGNEEMKKITRADFRNYSFKTPRYFAVFFNQEKTKVLADKNVRLALNYLTDKDQLLSAVLDNGGEKTETPIPPVLKESAAEIKGYKFDPAYAATILENSGWTEQEDKFRLKEIKEKTKNKKTGKMEEIVKERIPLEFTLVTGDSPELQKIAENLRTQWQAAGVKANLNFLKPADVQSAIKNRDYDALLFGEILNLDPDPYIFWHSSETRDPGLNLALYANREVDKLLEDARGEFDASKREALFARFQAAVVGETPAIFLFNPYFSYWMKTEVQGFGGADPKTPEASSEQARIITMPADRFSGMDQWYLATKRVWRGWK